MTRTCFAVSACCILLLCVVHLPAQTALGTITGTITDPTGSPVPAVEVIATATATGLTYRGRTNETGVYVIPNVPIGQFEMTASAQGFKQVQRSGINVEVAQRLRVDMAMQVGDVTESIQVVAEVLRVQKRIRRSEPWWSRSA